jgi:hypothetical protein
MVLAVFSLGLRPALMKKPNFFVRIKNRTLKQYTIPKDSENFVSQNYGARNLFSLFSDKSFYYW